MDTCGSLANILNDEEQRALTKTVTKEEVYKAFMSMKSTRLQGLMDFNQFSSRCFRMMWETEGEKNHKKGG